ncbi:MAG: hypothetical protein ACKPA7_03915 [Sphaerospermopsis kisseleviana]
MSEEQPLSIRESFIRCWFVMFRSAIFLLAGTGVYPNPLPTLTRDWVPEPVRESYPGFYKYVRVAGTGDRPYVFILNTNRGTVHNIRTTFMPGSYWKNVTINSKDELVRGELTKSWDSGCLESAVIMRRSGIIQIGGMRVTDAKGNSLGTVDLTNCKEKND